MVGWAATKKQMTLKDRRPGSGQSCEEKLNPHQCQQRLDAHSDGWLARDSGDTASLALGLLELLLLSDLSFLSFPIFLFETALLSGCF